MGVGFEYTGATGTTLPGSKLDVNGNLTVGYYGTAAPANGAIISGNVGIGTTSPAEKLHVVINGASSAIAAKMVNTGGTDGAFNGLYADNGAATVSGLRLGGFLFGGAYNASGGLHNSALIAGYSDEAFTSSTGGSSLRFETMNIGTSTRTEKMRITSTGNVGIGTTNPTANVHISSVSTNTPELLITNASSKGAFPTNLLSGTANSLKVSAGSDNTGTYWFTDWILPSGAAYRMNKIDSTWGQNANTALQFVKGSDSNGSGWAALESVYHSGLLLSTYPARPITFNINRSEVARIDSNGNVCIGTTSPQKKLHMEGDFGIGGGKGIYVRNTNASGYSELIFDNDNTYASGQGNFVFGYGGSSTADANHAYFYQRLNAPLRFGTSNLERMRIDGTGNVGIGTATPGAKLDVYTTNSTGNDALRIRNVYQTDSAIRMTAGSGTGDFSFRMRNEGEGSLDLYDVTNSKPRFIVGSAGAIGLNLLDGSGGNSTPIYDLGLSNYANRTIGLQGSGSGGAANGPGSDLKILAGPGASASVADKNGGNLILSGGIATGAGTSSILFQTSGGGASSLTVTSPTTRMTVLGNGNVGIGTTTPTSLFTVAGDANTTGNLTSAGVIYAAEGAGVSGTPSIAFSNKTTTGIAATYPNGNAGNGISLIVAGSEVMRLGSAGVSFQNGITSLNLGSHAITQTAADEMTLGLAGGGSAYNGKFNLYTQQTNAASNLLRIGSSSSNCAALTTSMTYSPSASSLAFSTMNAGTLIEAMRIGSTGNVGMGTTSPSRALHISGNQDSELGLAVQNTSATTNALSTFRLGTDLASNGGAINYYGSTWAGGSWASANTFEIAAYGGATGGYQIRTSANAPIKFQTQNLDRMVVTGTGNVGIGTTTPGAVLEVASTRGGTDAVRFRENTQAANARIFFSTPIGTGPDLNIASDRILLNGIVRASSFETVNGFSMTGGSGTTIQSTTVILKSDNANTEIFKGGYNQDTIIKPYSSSYNIQLAPSGGNVGIGTAAPAAKLEVNESSTGYSTIRFYNPSTGITAGTGGINQQFGFYNTDNAFTEAVSLKATKQGTFQGGNAATFNSDFTISTIGSATLAERLRITSTGNVGFGTTAPAATMHVMGTTEQQRIGYDVTKYLKTVVDSGGRTTITTSGVVSDFSEEFALVAGKYSRTFMTVNAAGGIGWPQGIGVSSQGFAINGGTNTAYTSDHIYFGVVATGSDIGLDRTAVNRLRVTNANFGGYGTLEAGQIVVGSSYGGSAAPSNGMLVKGNVGIGTTTPSQPLHVVQALSATPGNPAVQIDTSWNNNSGSTMSAVVVNATVTNSPDPNSRLIELRKNGSNVFNIDMAGNLRGPNSSGHYFGTAGSIVNASNNTTFHSYDSSIFTTNNGEALRITQSRYVGIGTAAPQTKLEVVGDTNTFIMRAPTSTSYGSFRVYNDQNIATRALEIGYGGSAYGGALVSGGATGESAYIASTGNYPLQLGTSNTLRMIITGVGNVGIGTTAPTALLDVAATSFPKAMINFSRKGAGDWGLTLGNEAISNVYIGLTGDTAKYFWRANWDTAGVAVNTFQTANTANSNGGSYGLTTVNILGVTGQTGDLFAVTGAGQTMGNLFKIQQNGNVGIGTTSPLTKLHVNGSLAVDAAGGSIPFIYGANPSGNYGSLRIGAGTASFQNQPHIQFIGHDSAGVVGGTSGFMNLRAGSGFGAYPGAFVFETYSAGSVLTERVRIDGSMGNVGIGTTSPAQALDVAGNVQLSGASRSIQTSAPGTGAAYSLTLQAGNAVSGGAGGNINLYAGAGAGGPGQGTVNITSSSGILLTGPTTVSNSGPNTGTAFTVGAGGTNSFVVSWDNTGGNTNYALARKANFTSATSYSFDSNVGIGTTTPSSLLTIGGYSTSGGGGTTVLQAGTDGSVNAFNNEMGFLSNARVSSGTVNLFDTSKPSWYFAGRSGSSYDDFIVARAPANTTAYATILTAKASGNVGIGTTSPSFLFEVNGVAKSTSLKLGSSSGAIAASGNFSDGFSVGGLNMNSSNVYTSGSLNVKGDAGINLQVGGGVTPLAILVNGNVGIGTTSPSALLSVGSSASSTFQVASTGTGYFNNGTTETFINTAGLEIRPAGTGNSTSSVLIKAPFNAYQTRAFTLDQPNAKLNIQAGPGDNGGGVARGGGDGITYFYSDANYLGSASLALATAGTNRLFINAAGNVGIGTTAPTNALSVAGSFNFVGDSSTIRTQQCGTTCKGFDFLFPNSGIFRPVESSVKGTNDVFFQGVPATTSGYTILESYNSAGLVMGTGGNTNPILFQINRIEKMRIDSSGNVGIGTTSPVAPLDVANNTTSTNTAQFGNFGIQSYSNTNGFLSQNMYYNGSNSIYRQSAAVALFQFGYPAAGDIGFRTAAAGTAGNSISFTDVLTVKNTGNVGIGTTTPVVPLHITKDTSAGGTAKVLLNLFSSSATTGSSWILGQNDINHSLEFGYYGSGETTYRALVPNAAYISGQTSSAATVINSKSGYVAIATNDFTERMRIDSPGNVGVGTTTPAGILEVSSSNTTSVINFLNTNTNGREIVKFQNTASGGNFDFRIYGSGYSETLFGQNMAGSAAWIGFSPILIGTNSADPIIFGSSNSEKMRLTSAGNVGMGTTTPTAILQVTQAGGTTGKQLLVQGTGSQEILIDTTDASSGSQASVDYHTPSGYALTGLVATGGRILNSSVANEFIFNNRIGPIVFSSDSAYSRKDIYIATSGNVGIGPIGPQKKLHVAGTSVTDSQYGMIRISPSATNGEASIGFFSDTGGSTTNTEWVAGVSGWGSTGNFIIGNENGSAGGNARLAITPAGNVGIGTTAPGRTYVTTPLDIAIPFSKTDTSARYGVFIGGNDTNPLGAGFYVLGGATAAARSFNIQGTELGASASNLNLNPQGGNVGMGTTAS